MDRPRVKHTDLGPTGRCVSCNHRLGTIHGSRCQRVQAQGRQAETRFIQGQIVTATASAQGLVAGARYEVVEVRVERTPFGGFTEYVVRAAPGYAPGKHGDIHVINGHLILNEVFP